MVLLVRIGFRKAHLIRDRIGEVGVVATEFVTPINAFGSTGPPEARAALNSNNCIALVARLFGTIISSIVLQLFVDNNKLLPRVG